MNRSDLLDLYDFTSFAWDRIREAVPDDADLVHAAPGSGWPALRNCLGHVVLAYERWVPAIAELRTRDLPTLRDGELRTWAQLDAYRDRVRAALRAAILDPSEEELTALRDVDVDGETLRYSRAELVLHLLLHERGHHGDVTTLLWQLGRGDETILEYRFHLGHDR